METATIQMRELEPRQWPWNRYRDMIQEIQIQEIFSKNRLGNPLTPRGFLACANYNGG